MSYIWFDPLTLSGYVKVTDSDRGKLLNVLYNIINSVSSPCNDNVSCARFFNEVADKIVDSINKGWEEYFKSQLWRSNKLADEVYFVLIPADTRFPGFVNSIGDHMLTTSAFAVSASLSYFDLCNKGGYVEAYGIQFDRELLRGFVRVSALLHDIGKPPIKDHVQRTRDTIRALFSNKVPEQFLNALVEASSRHHYSFYYKDLTPRNFIEWIIAFSDKASASSRTFLIKERIDTFEQFLDIAKEIQSNQLYDLGGLDLLNSFEKGISESEEDSETLRTYGLFNQDEKRALDLAKTLINAEKNLCGENKNLLALYNFEVPSIKSYLKRGRELSLYSGYSIMIDSYIHKVSDYIKSVVGNEAVLSDEGGSVLAIVPSTFTLDEKVKNSIPFDTLRESKMDFSFAEAYLGPKENWTGWGNKDVYLRDSLRGFGALLNKFFALPPKIEIKKVSGSFSKLCSKCKINPVEEGDTCELCSLAEKYYNAYKGLIKGEKNDEIAKEVERLRIYRLVEELKEMLENKVDVRVIFGLDMLESNYANSEKVDIEHRRMPVFIAGDGDNFGLLKSNSSTLTQFIAVNRFFTYMIYYSLLYAFEKVALFNVENYKEPVIEFFPILLGGDDFFLILSAQNLLPFAYYMDEALKTINGRINKNEKINYTGIADKITKKKPYYWFGISAGAYVYQDASYPIFLARERAEHLEKKSKEFSKTCFQSTYNGSGLIITILDEKFINAEIKKRGVTILGEEAKSVHYDVKTLEDSRINYRKLQDYVKLQGDTLKIYYDVARNNKDALENVFNVISSANNKGLGLHEYIILLTIMSKVLERKTFSNICYYKASKW